MRACRGKLHREAMLSCAAGDLTQVGTAPHCAIAVSSFFYPLLFTACAHIYTYMNQIKRQLRAHKAELEVPGAIVRAGAEHGGGDLHQRQQVYSCSDACRINRPLSTICMYFDAQLILGLLSQSPC